MPHHVGGDRGRHGDEPDPTLTGGMNTGTLPGPSYGTDGTCEVMGGRTRGRLALG